ncbi:LacI family DNA-binding transcriptional regulator [Streptomyces sanglieri]|uniref:LacI family DNA-binding transcriptional regulator n=1 Tax=Streptomyces sanglieri TaxID=193460 RepID=A0ABW2X885_9ACTN
MSGVTIHQVAEAAGVSASTVSNVLNGRTDRMQAATLARVEQVIEQLSYRPNRAARMLRTGRIKVIGLIVPSVANPFWGRSPGSWRPSRSPRGTTYCSATASATRPASSSTARNCSRTG